MSGQYFYGPSWIKRARGQTHFPNSYFDQSISLCVVAVQAS